VWQAAVETAAPAALPGVGVGEDGRVIASFRADAAASLEGEELAPITGGGGVAVFARGGGMAWSRALPGRAGAVALSGQIAAVAIAGDGSVELGGAPVALRGAPGAAIVGLAGKDGADRWVRPVGATGWVVVRAMAALPGGEFAVAGSFAGTLRAGDAVVTAGGSSDGFTLRLGPDGAVRWLMRIGGAEADAITAVAAAPDGLVVGGTFTGGADARGIALEPIDPDVIAPDGFVARLADDGTVTWAKAFGGGSDDAVAGVAVSGRGIIGVAATLRDVAVVDGKQVTVRGQADAALLTFDAKGNRRAVALIGGADYDSASGLGARGDFFVMAAAYAGALVLGATHLDAAGGDGAVIMLLDDNGAVRGVHDIAGDGRETVAALAGAPGGWAATVSHTAGAAIDGQTFAAPSDPYGGAFVIVREE
jgi:hypothetical protein